MDVKLILENMLECSLTKLERIGDGRNSKVYKAESEDSKQYAVKFYYYHTTDSRNRLNTEFYSLKYLWDSGVRCVPQPLFIDTENQCAIYNFIKGEKIFCSEIHETDIDKATQFLIHLNKLSQRNVEKFPPASEACFSVQTINKNIEYRLQKLQAIPHETFFYDDLQKFLNNDYQSLLSEISNWCELRLSDMGFTPDQEISDKERTLSPSDFGYHNALRLPDKSIIFLDFEYFGWDDPAKMISDFLLHPHPAMQLTKELKKRYVSNLLNHFGYNQNLEKRVEIVYPLFGLKWCMIVLNEFVPEFYSRRNFANAEKADKQKKLLEQLEKAKTLLNNIRENYATFPYAN